MAYPDSVAQVTPAAGGTLDGNAALKKLAIDNKLRLKMTLDEIWEKFASPVIQDPDGIDIPDSVFLRFSMAPMKGSNRVTVALTTPYTGSLQVGDKYIPGTEAKDVLKHFTMYYGEYAYAVARDNFGRVANEMDMYKVYETQTPKIAHYLSEMKGYRIREALLETVDHVTANDAANSGVVSQAWNPNWYIANADPTVADTDDFGMPLFAANATFDDRIGAALIAAVGATPTAAKDANATFKMIRNMAWYARLVKNIEQFDDGTLKLTIPSSQIEILKDEQTDAGKVYLDQYRKEGDVVNYAFRVGRISNVELYCDDRYPVVTQTVTTGAHVSLAPTYCAAGGVDGRDFTPHQGYTGTGTETGNFDIGYLCGKAAVAEWEVDPVHYETEKSNYGKREGNGAFGASGYSLVQYDDDTGYTTPGVNRVNIGSMVVAFSSTDLR